MFDWDMYLECGIEQNAVWKDELRSMIDRLKGWNENLIRASERLSSELVISHRDLDPKNVMWSEGKPYLIDWEAAGYVNPYQELLELLNYWADDGKGQLIKGSFDTLYNAYRKYDECNIIDWEDVLISGYSGMLGWLDYSFKRSLGIESGTEEEIKLGTEQVFGTIEDLIAYENKTLVLREWLCDKKR